VVVGGKTGTLSRLITEQIRQVVKTHVIGSNGKRTEISTSELSEGVFLGAAALVIHRTFYSLAR
jgi:hypothetical protein